VEVLSCMAAAVLSQHTLAPAVKVGCMHSLQSKKQRPWSSAMMLGHQSFQWARVVE
jgi:hypothetical protein